MSIRILPWLLSTVLLITVSPAETQQAKKISRIGYLAFGTSDGLQSRTEAFRRSLRELGYIEGQNITIEYRYAEGKQDRLPELAAELIRLKVDVLVVQNNSVARAASKLTTTIPIVLSGGTDPVVAGLVASLARPGGNVTGLTNLTRDLGVKRLELLKEILPKLARVAILPSPGFGSGQGLKEMQAAAPSLQIQLHILEVRSANDLIRAFEAATKARAGALVVTSDPTGQFRDNQKQIIELATKHKLPAIYSLSRYTEAGGLMSYAASELEMSRRTAVYVDKILKGAKPAELPVEQPTKFEFVINLKAAKQIGLTIPQSVLYRADKVIK
jgi:putative ABC transport system substrate-binding protein